MKIQLLNKEIDTFVGFMEHHDLTLTVNTLQDDSGEAVHVTGIEGLKCGCTRSLVERKIISFDPERDTGAQSPYVSLCLLAEWLLGMQWVCIEGRPGLTEIPRRLYLPDEEKFEKRLYNLAKKYHY